MKITIERKSNGIHSYLEMNIEDVNDKLDIDIIKDVLDVVITHNDDAVKNA